MIFRTVVIVNHGKVDNEKNIVKLILFNSRVYLNIPFITCVVSTSFVSEFVLAAATSERMIEQGKGTKIFIEVPSPKNRSNTL